MEEVTETNIGTIRFLTTTTTTKVMNSTMIGTDTSDVSVNSITTIIPATTTNNNDNTLVKYRISAEIESITGQIRRALECPICLILVSNMSCFCPNGHAVCDVCFVRMWNINAVNNCPICRSQMTEVSAMAMKLAEAITLVKVACAHRPYGCMQLIAVFDVNEHEAECVYMPNVRCLMSTCQWIGNYEQLFEHVCHTHPKNCIDSITVKVETQYSDVMWWNLIYFFNRTYFCDRLWEHIIFK